MMASYMYIYVHACYMHVRVVVHNHRQLAGESLAEYIYNIEYIYKCTSACVVLREKEKSGRHLQLGRLLAW